MRSSNQTTKNMIGTTPPGLGGAPCRGRSTSPARDPSADPCATWSELADVINTHRRELVSRARWLTGNEQDGWDLFQDTVVRALRGRKTVPVGMSTAWLRRIMYNLFVDGCRTRKVRARWGVPTHWLTGPPASESDLPPVWEPLPPGALDEAVRTLSPSARKVFTLHAAGASYAEIAGQLGISVNTVGTRLFRSRLKLRQVLLATLAATPSALATPSGFV